MNMTNDKSCQIKAFFENLIDRQENLLSGFLCNLCDANSVGEFSTVTYSLFEFKAQF